MNCGRKRLLWTANIHRNAYKQRHFGESENFYTVFTLFGTMKAKMMLMGISGNVS